MKSTVLERLLQAIASLAPVADRTAGHSPWLPGDEIGRLNRMPVDAPDRPVGPPGNGEQRQ